ncbi:hypothetical protein Afil01_28680 [Actinorhabdospora filicis]|uniref:Uncharacterized protein n=1 Tax=Actinorhabdospora filicis TaxID=1785913 RepID=A0A9W6SLM7_9ACTN|nr:hypothetical protein [Actinorhabdospora filicis]GLZ78061.1 hypothetical protein Afil01_28680 [Actinorhabdospora filicis]
MTITPEGHATQVALLDQLEAAGDLRGLWRPAFAAVDRSVFIPPDVWVWDEHTGDHRLIRRARGFASLQMTKECHQLLARAEAALGAIPNEAPSPWVSRFDEGSLANSLAHCMRQLGDLSEVHARRSGSSRCGPVHLSEVEPSANCSWSAPSSAKASQTRPA